MAKRKKQNTTTTTIIIIIAIIGLISGLVLYNNQLAIGTEGEGQKEFIKTYGNAEWQISTFTTIVNCETSDVEHSATVTTNNVLKMTTLANWRSDQCGDFKATTVAMSNDQKLKEGYTMNIEVFKKDFSSVSINVGDKNIVPSFIELSNAQTYNTQIIVRKASNGYDVLIKECETCMEKYKTTSNGFNAQLSSESAVKLPDQRSQSQAYISLKQITLQSSGGTDTNNNNTNDNTIDDNDSEENIINKLSNNTKIMIVIGLASIIGVIIVIVRRKK
jgi:hypothetical protein